MAVSMRSSILGAAFLAIVLQSVFLITAATAAAASSGVTSPFRRKLEATIDMPLDSDVFRAPLGYNAPQQVHITQGDLVGEAIIISWITPSEPGPDLVQYGLASGNYSHSKRCAFVNTYTYYNYTSGFIHHCRIDNLKPSTKYYYKLGDGASAREFWFHTPPPVGPDTPYTFGIIGDLGQTFDSNRTLEHYIQGSGETLLYVGDLSYADNYLFHDNNRWDTWGRFVERSTAYQPWIWTAGNHELDFLPEVGETVPFKPYLHRFRVPYQASNSTSPLWYSIKRASTHIIVLSSYSAFGTYTPQYRWLQTELASVDRSTTPWLIVLMHSPWYNSNEHHYMEGETMRVQFESWFVEAKVDIVFAGHVHAYERTYRISNTNYNVVNGECTPQANASAPIYIVVGDGGNAEGLAAEYTEPQPAYSAFREASFGHAMLEIKNRTHAYYYWHRNQDGKAVVADSLWLSNQYWSS